ncbi:anti-sigma-K factor RskA [Paraburkholderia sp. UCT70]|uniref:hypothetical protein n=1 Tax=Paraburkholderia sp. UCT70 TaxID=2991068 RepID=UPI003D24E9C0
MSNKHDVASDDVVRTLLVDRIAEAEKNIQNFKNLIAVLQRQLAALDAKTKTSARS